MDITNSQCHRRGDCRYGKVGVVVDALKASQDVLLLMLLLLGLAMVLLSTLMYYTVRGLAAI